MTSELEGAALDLAVAMAEGHTFPDLKPGDVVSSVRLNAPPPFNDWIYYAPSTNWAQGGPIIEREFMTVEFDDHPDYECWLASIPNRDIAQHGKTPLIAAMRAFVESKT